MVDRLRAWHVERLPAFIGEPLAEVNLVGVDEELRVEPTNLAAGFAAHQQRRALGPVNRLRYLAAALNGCPVMDEERRGQRCQRPRESPCAGLGVTVGVEQLGACGGRCGVLF